MSASTIVKLQLLKYPKLEDFNYKMESVRQFKVVILFLEEEVIRALDVEERHKIKLVDDMYSEEYIEALTNYYSVLEAPAVLINLIPSACTNDDDPRNCSARLMLLEYALSQAIQYSYTDQKAFFNQSSNDVLLTNTTKIDNNSDASANRMDDTDGAANETLDEEVAILAKALGPLLQVRTRTQLHLCEISPRAGFQLDFFNSDHSFTKSHEFIPHIKACLLPTTHPHTYPICPFIHILSYFSSSLTGLQDARLPLPSHRRRHPRISA